MRADHMSLYGYDVPTTPHLEELAQEATVYSRCLAQAPGTSESVPSLLSGVSPYKHGGISLIRSVPEEILLLPETLQEHGYETIALSANPWVSGYHGLDQGFEVFRSYNTDNELFIYDIVKLLRRIAPWKVFHYRNCLPVVSYVPISRLIEDAVDILQTRDWSRPLFLYIHPLDPHGPYQPPSRYLHVNEEEFTPEDYIYFKDLNPGVKVNQRQYRMITALYDGEITYVDAELDRLLDVLKREGLYESSLIIITSDHGEQFQEHDLWQHSNSLYQQLLHVPLIIKFPYQEEGEVVDEWVATIDIVPTVLDRLGIHSDGVEGMPLNRPYIAGPRPFFSYKMDGELNSQPTMRGVMLDGWKLIMIPEGNGMKEELYRVNIDPSDSNDLRQAYPEIAVRLDGILEEYERRTVQADILKTKTIDSREEERLRSLGYIE
jgi:arylsulfatase A-like enzyme